MVILTRILKTMANLGQKVGLPLSEAITSLERFAPSTFAENWDNVGLLIDSMTHKPIQTVLLTNDLTEDVVEEAVKNHTDLIISYHPNIFRPLKSVSDKTWKERIVIQCIKNNISVYSPHTCWDAVNGGVNDWLASALPYSKCNPIQVVDTTHPEHGSGRILELSTPLAVGKIVEKIKSHIGIPHLRLAIARQKDQASIVSKVALCAGSGGSLLSGVQADLYLTGEMLHHDILDATQKGIHVILCNHSDSERGFLRQFQKKLVEDIFNNQVAVIVSQTDRDPIITV